MAQYRYLCTNCVMGWHEVPRCPFPDRSQPRYRERSASEMRSLRHIWKLQDEGVLPTYGEMASRWRWRWLFYGLLALFVFFALLIVF